MKPFFLLTLTIIALLIALHFADQWVDPTATTQPFMLPKDSTHVSPFTAMRWRGDVAEVRYDDTWFELRSVDKITVDQLIDYLTESNDSSPRTHLAENLVDVLTSYGHKPGATVRLVLRTLDPQVPRTITIAAAVMNASNLDSVMAYGRGFQDDGDQRANESLAILDAKHERLVDQMNKYTIEYRAADADLKSMVIDLASKGGFSLGADACPKEIELKRWVTEQADLATQSLKLDIDQTQLREKKALDKVAPAITQTVDANTDLIGARAAVREAKERLDSILANAGDKSDAAAASRRAVEVAQKQMEALEAAIISKATQDYEDDLTWRRQNIKQRLDGIGKIVERLQQEVAQISNMKRILARREAEAEAYRTFIMHYDEQIREIEATARAQQPK